MTLNVTAITHEDTHRLVESILDKIVRDDMDDVAKAKAVFDYVRQKIHYTAVANYSEPHIETYFGLKYGRGDCYAYAIASEFLLAKAGIDNRMLTRVGGTTRHYWNLVNIGGEWFHFDTCPNRDGSNERRFLFDEPTAKELAELSAYRLTNYYTYDHSLHPRVVGCDECN